MSNHRRGVLVAAAITAVTISFLPHVGHADDRGDAHGRPVFPGQRPAADDVSINSTSVNRDRKPRRAVRENAIVRNSNFTVIGINDLGMHCGDLDTRILSILPPYNVLHAQVIRKGPRPTILKDDAVGVSFSAASSRFDTVFAPDNPQPPGFDIVGGGAPFAGVYKTNFWDSVNAGAYNPFYPFDIVPPPIPLDLGLIVPDPAELPSLVVAQQAMPGIRVPYVQNDHERFARFETDLPFFASFPFGYSLTNLNWFSADGVPITTFDDFGRVNPYPLMRVAAFDNRNRRVLATVDTVMPISGEADCRNCHTNDDASNGELGGAIVGPGGGLPVATAFDDPQFGKVPLAVSVEYAQDLNILRFHDRNRTQTNSNNYTDTAGNPIPCVIDAANPNGNENCLINKALVQGKPVVCQACHYTPALDLAQVGPLGGSLQFNDTSGLTNANGRAQRNKPTMSRAIHRRAHGTNGRFSPFEMPPPNLPDFRNQVVTAQACVFSPTTGTVVAPTAGSFAAARCDECAARGLSVAQCAVEQTCYQCHPGTFTKCLRGAMGGSGTFCQDCHGDMEQVGNDFSVAFSTAFPFGSPEAAAAGSGLRIPWADEPGCQSCHLGDAVNQPADKTGFIYAADGIRLLQAWTPVNVAPVVIDGTQFQPASTLARPISSPNSRFAEDEIEGKRVLFRFSKGGRAITLPNGQQAFTGHRGVFCQACHGSTHAEWPVTPNTPAGVWPPPEGSFAGNDNVTAGQLQGHTGTIIECDTCHKGNFNVKESLGGPHGMHPVGGKDSTGYSQWWVNNHRNVLGEDASLQDKIDRCGVCHGVEGQGTVLSVMRQDRTLIRFGGRQITIKAGDKVACTTCHTRGNPMAPESATVAARN